MEQPIELLFATGNPAKLEQLAFVIEAVHANVRLVAARDRFGEQAIYEELDKIIDEGVTDQELQKVKNNKLVNFYRKMSTINGKADSIGTYEIFFGSYKKLFDAPREYDKVTSGDIKTAAAKYLKKSNRTVGILKSKEE